MPRHPEQATDAANEPDSSGRDLPSPSKGKAQSEYDDNVFDDLTEAEIVACFVTKSVKDGEQQVSHPKSSSQSEYHDSLFDDLNEEELSALVVPGSNKTFPDREADDPIKRSIQEKFSYLDDSRSQAGKAPFEVDIPLPPVLIQQRNGDFLDKFKHDANLRNAQWLEERDPHKQIVLMLNPTRQGFSYLQPQDFRGQMNESKGIDVITIERLFRNAGVPLALADEKRAIDHQTMIRSPADPDRFVEAGDLRRAQPEAMVQAKDVFVQNGYTGRNFVVQLTGNFTDLMSRINAKDPNKRHLIGSQYQLLSELKRATAEAMSKPDFVWSSDITVPERKDLAKKSWLRDLEISDHLLNRIGLRLTYRAPSNDISRTPPSSETSDDEIPYEVSRAGPPTTTSINIDPAHPGSLKRLRDDAANGEPHKRLRSARIAMAEEDTPTSKPPRAPLDDSATTKRHRSNDGDDVNLPQEKKARFEDAGPTGFLHLPNELIGKIGTHLVTGELSTTVSALTPLRLASRRVDVAVRDAVPGYDAAVKLSHLSDDIYRQAIPEGQFPVADIPYPESLITFRDDTRSDTSSVSEDMSRPVTAADRISAIGPILKYQSGKRCSELIEKILNINDFPQQVEAIAATAPHIKAFSEADRSRLFGGTVKAVNEVDFIDDPKHSAVCFASKSFLEKTWPHMREADHVKITGGSSVDDSQEADRPTALPMFNNRYVYDLIQTDREQEASQLELESLTSTSRESPPMLEQEGAPVEQAPKTPSAGTRLSTQVQSIADEVEQARTSNPADSDNQNSWTAIKRLGSVTDRLAGTFENARQALLEQERDRSRSR